MFSSFRNFVSRHKRKFIITGIVIGGSFVALKFAQKKLRDFQESQATDLMDKAKRSCHFDSTEQTCNQTVISLAGNLCEIVVNLSDTDQLLELIKTNPERKLEYWDQLKITSFTRITTVVYAASMLVISLRVQINLLGGYLCKDTITNIDTGAKIITNDIQQTYLSFIEYFLKDGIPALYEIIEVKVGQVMKNFNLKQKLTLADVEQLFWSIQTAVNSSVLDPNSHMAKFVLPDVKNIDLSNEVLNKMFTETLDMLESDEVVAISTNNISRGFTHIVDKIAEFYVPPKTPKIVDVTNQTTAGSSKSLLNEIVNVNTIEIPLAKLIPIINGFTSAAFNNSVKPPSLFQTLFTSYLLSDKVKMLGANVYEVFSQ